MKKYTRNEKIVHWLMAVTILYLGFTAIVNEFWYSKEAIIKSLQFSFPMLGLITPDASELLFMARMLRRAAWDWHFYGGVILSVLFVIKTYTWIKKSGRENKWLNIVVITLVFVMSVSGIILFERIENNINADIIDLSRKIHHVASYLLGVVIAVHIGNVIRKKSLSKMI